MAHDGRDARLAMLAGRQAGAFTFTQALEMGFPKATVHRRLKAGAWRRLYPGVYSVSGGCQTRLQEMWAAVLAVGAGSVVTHESAAVAHGAEHLPLAPIVLTNAHGWHHQLGSVFVHQINDLGPSDVVDVHGLRISSPARSVIELGATQPMSVVARVADDLVAARKTTFGAIEAAFGRVVRPGKPGMRAVARVLDERSDAAPVPQSALERLLLAVLDAGGLPTPRLQVPLPGRGGIRGIVDAAYVDALLLLEADGRRWHARIETARRDRERDAQAARVGWQTLRFGYEELTRDPAEVCATVSDTLSIRLGLRQAG